MSTLKAAKTGFQYYGRAVVALEDMGFSFLLTDR